MTTNAEERLDAVRRLIEHYETYTEMHSIPTERLRHVIGHEIPKVGETIEDVAKLEALPIGSVVLSCHGNSHRSWHRYKPHTTHGFQYHKWMCADGGIVRADYDGAILLPVKVLHVGDGK